MNKRIYKKSAKNNIKRRRKSTRNHRKKMRGGVIFNSPIDSFRPIPSNTYENDPSRDVTTARTLPFSQFGGKTKRKRGKRGKKMKRVRKSRKMRGGSLVGTDMVSGINTSHSNNMLAFGTTGGSEYMLDKITGQEIPGGSALTPESHMVPLV
jgi:hypothetical protein